MNHNKGKNELKLKPMVNNYYRAGPRGPVEAQGGARRPARRLNRHGQVAFYSIKLNQFLNLEK